MTVLPGDRLGRWDITPWGTAFLGCPLVPETKVRCHSGRVTAGGRGTANEREDAGMGGREGMIPLGLADVTGPSMVPTLRHGDRLLVRYAARVRAGDVVVLRHPLQQDLLIVKRAVGRRDGGWWVLSDNPFAEPDSRVFGVVPDDLVLARVLWRFRPRGTGARSALASLTWAAFALRPVSVRARGRALAPDFRAGTGGEAS
ncbi:nickel-type superoxide dismutase maturation protease [Streptomyces sp. SL13]|uniref:Nickel-type superoxide dismutase maturation protease n=1 Tax=Streptantibioticus silvisoli TaxID=2705255 RepID=A0AA90GZA0_9ACTN|nr:nickel-type superoxide dismutase maturation protease [Streptantibioticus silvisoli]MDI5970344.1 nickel-type superoxide dismutase maturation protease [Streptantibioticus silvisoli]